MIELNLDKEDCKNLADFIDEAFFSIIRENEDIDNIEWVRSILNAYDEFILHSK